MKCPHCSSELKLLAPAIGNAEAYGGRPKSVTKCCGNIIQVRRIISFEISIPFNHSDLKHDDWQNPIGKK